MAFEEETNTKSDDTSVCLGWKRVGDLDNTNWDRWSAEGEEALRGTKTWNVVSGKTKAPIPLTEEELAGKSRMEQAKEISAFDELEADFHARRAKARQLIIKYAGDSAMAQVSRSEFDAHKLWNALKSKFQGQSTTLQQSHDMVKLLRLRLDPGGSVSTFLDEFHKISSDLNEKALKDLQNDASNDACWQEITKLSLTTQHFLHKEIQFITDRGLHGILLNALPKDMYDSLAMSPHNTDVHSATSAL